MQLLRHGGSPEFFEAVPVECRLAEFAVLESLQVQAQQLAAF